ncbi:hypothetical protein FNV43_RR04359 [Rhamnella rubrinervis]|uniref:Uncharacterized protein n=1 Tax=Rhamnella rubrinervis TaxID=2594499 RepID=A0A8K0HKV8_9ROSA|nr:hypothetical protein FNV43_RR04359 [Rhamnella rubrinervis]
MYDSSSNNKEIYEYRGSKAEYLDDTSEGEAIFHTAFFEYGLHLSLLSVFQEILHKLRLAPGQLTPNCLRSTICEQRFKEVNSSLCSRIDFAKSQLVADKNYKNLLLPEKITKYFSYEILFCEGNLIMHTMTIEGMKKRLNEMRKSEASEKRGTDRSKGPKNKKNKSTND